MVSHEMSVSQLRALLAELKDDDVLMPNAVENLTVIRDARCIGFIDFLLGRAKVEIFDDRDLS